MPFKERLKSGKGRKRKKPTYKIKNWSDYNKSLKKRGEVSLYFPKGDIRAIFINDHPYEQGVSGRHETYRNPYIEAIYVLYRLFGWGQRQITGYFEDLWKQQGLDIPVPSFGHLSDMFGKISVELKQYCSKLKRKIDKGEKISLIADSTGLRFGKAGYWYETKYNKPCKKTPWKKLNLSMDEDFNMVGLEITDYDKGDNELIDNLIPDNVEIQAFIADGSYYSISKVEELYKYGITPVIPPPINAVVKGKDNTTWHDKIVQYIKDKGSVYAFHKKYGYGKRCLVEAQISRIKRCIGTSLSTQKLTSQKNEGIVIANIINLWNSFGRCVSEKMG